VIADTAESKTMASSEIDDLIIATTASSLEYLMPVVGIMIGITFVITMFMSVTFGAIRRMFKGE